MAVAIVHLLEVVEVRHYEAERCLEPPAALDLAVEDRTERARVGKAGQLVRYGLALDRRVEARVVDRHDRLARQVLEELFLLAREGTAPPGHGENPQILRLGGRNQGPHRHRQRVGIADPGRARAARAGRRRLGVDWVEQLGPHLGARLERLPLGRDDRLVQRGVVSTGRVLVERPPLERQCAPGLRVAGVDRLAHRQSDHAVPVEPGGECVADAADRRLQLLALSFVLLDLRLELRRHAVELAPQLGELVAAGDRDGVGEVPAREASCGAQECADLPRERAADAGRGEYGEEEEGEQQAADHEPVLGDCVGHVAGVVEERELHRRTGRLRDALHTRAIVGAVCRLDVVGIAETA